MNFINTKYRTDAVETMDDFSMEGEVLREALDKIAVINQFLGGNQLTLEGVRKLMDEHSENQKVTIVDIGCGNGDMLRKLAEMGVKSKISMELVGIDANDFTIRHAEKLSSDYPNITYRCQNIFDSDFQSLTYDIGLCTLTLHHFKDEEIIRLLQLMYQNSRIGIVVNDLHRNSMAYRLFQMLSKVMGLNAMSREDGLISILKGFKRKELINFSDKLNLKKYQIQWKWAFRYQWIIYKI